MMGKLHWGWPFRSDNKILKNAPHSLHLEVASSFGSPFGALATDLWRPWKGLFTRKPSGHGFWESLDCSVVDNVLGPCFRVYRRGGFGPLSITFFLDENSTWNLTCMASMDNVWLGLWRIFFKTSLEGRHDEFATLVWVITKGCSPWASESMVSPKRGVSWSFKSHILIPLV